jgi:hypothetical protein
MILLWLAAIRSNCRNGYGSDAERNKRKNKYFVNRHDFLLLTGHTSVEPTHSGAPLNVANEQNSHANSGAIDRRIGIFRV